MWQSCAPFGGVESVRDFDDSSELFTLKSPFGWVDVGKSWDCWHMWEIYRTLMTKSRKKSGETASTIFCFLKIMPKYMCNLLLNAFLPPMLGPTIGLGADVLMCSQPRKVEFHGQKKPMRPWRPFSGLDLVSHERVLFECYVCLPLQ